MRVLLIHVVDAFEQFSGVEQIFLRLAKRLADEIDVDVAVAINKGVLFERLSTYNIKIYVLPDKGIVNILFFYQTLFHVLTNFNPEIIHSHHRYTTCIAHLMPFRSYKLIHTFHVEQFTRKWNRFFGDYATAVSKGCKDHFTRYFNLKNEFITVIYNGLDDKLENTTKALFKKNDSEIIASVIGRLTEQKGHSVLIKAISLLPSSVKERLKVIFVGDGEKQTGLKGIVEKIGLKDSIVFVGYQKDIYPYILSSDFTILPSLWEGFGLSIIESYLCSKPVIGSNVGGIPELIVDKETGLLVPPGDNKALAEAILFFIENPDVLEKYGKAGRKLAHEKFTVKKMINNYKRFYKGVLKGYNEN